MAQVVVIMTGDEAKLFKSFQRVIGQAKKLETGLGKTGKAGEKAGRQMEAAGKKGQKAFGPSAAGNITAVATKLGAVAIALRTVTAAFDNAAAAREKFAGQQEAGFDQLGQLAQLAETPKQMQALLAEARGYRAIGAVTTEGEGGNLVFALHSAGVTARRDRKMFGDLKAAGVVKDPVAMARAAASLQVSMGEEETGGFQAIMAKSFGASKISPSTAEEILQAAAPSGLFGGQMGMRDESVLAATAVVSKLVGARKAGTWTAQMMGRMAETPEKYEGQTLRESLLSIQAEGLSGEKLKQRVGGSEGLRAYKVITGNLALYDEALANIEAAQADPMTLEIKKNLFRTDPSMRAVYKRRVSEGRRDMDPWAQEAGIARNISIANRAQMNRQSGGGLWGGLTDWGYGVWEHILGSEEMYKTTGGGMSQESMYSTGITPGVTPGISSELAATLQKLDSTIGKLDATVRSQGGGRTLGKPGNN